jgi:hypothetical protein
VPLKEETTCWRGRTGVEGDKGRRVKEAMEWYGKGMVREEVPWSGYCTVNLALLVEMYVKEDWGENGVKAVMESNGGWDDDMKKQEKVRFKRLSAGVRVHLAGVVGNFKGGKQVKKNEVDFVKDLFKRGAEMGCVGGRKEMERVEEEIRIKQLEKNALGSIGGGRTLNVGSGVEEEEEEEVEIRVRQSGAKR